MSYCACQTMGRAGSDMAVSNKGTSNFCGGKANLAERLCGKFSVKLTVVALSEAHAAHQHPSLGKATGFSSLGAVCSRYHRSSGWFLGLIHGTIL